MPSLNLGQQRLIIILQPDEAGAGHGGMGDGHDLVRGAGGVRAPAVGGVVDPAVAQSEYLSC